MLIGIDSLDVERMGKFIQNERFLNKYLSIKQITKQCALQVYIVQRRHF